ncbi:sialic acid-binding Ig-like lectin 11 isoform X2 [Narcine bancroftii]|uniref:sialic acid-binding Ig-like lectin 11 isoform X2 n=1 Tax=Narcine bancroftii TaxID=1343680 RepID=UPI00383214F3
MGLVLKLLWFSLMSPGLSRASVSLHAPPSTSGDGLWGPCLLLPCDWHLGSAIWNLSAGVMLPHQEPLLCQQWWQCERSPMDPVNFTCNNVHSDSKQWDHLRLHVVLTPSDTNWMLNGSLVFHLDELEVKPDVTLPLLIEGVATTIECSYPLSCEGMRPQLTWSGVKELCNTSIQDGDRNDSLSTNLTFIPTVRDQGREVSCIAQYHLAAAETNRTIHLDVKYAPRNLTILLGGNDTVGVDLEVEEGSALSLLCRVESVPESNLTWLVGRTRRSESHGQNELWLEVEEVSYREHREIECLASNHLGQTQQQIRVTLQYAPKEVRVMVRERHRPLLEGDFLSLICPHKANPPATHTTWHVLDSNGKRTLVFTGATLDLHPIQRDNVGAYLCTVTNARGNGSSGTFLLDVHYRPEISKSSGCRRTPGGMFCVCKAQSNPPGHLSWHLPHTNLIGNQTHGSYRAWQWVDGQMIIGSLELPDTQALEEVMAWCTVQNPHGADTLKVYLLAAGRQTIQELLIPVLGTAAGTIVLTLLVCQLALCCSRRSKTARHDLVEMQGLTAVSGPDVEEHNSSPHRTAPELTASQTDEAGDHWSSEGEDEEMQSQQDWSEGQELHYASIDFSACRPTDGVVGARESTEYAKIKPQ